MTLFEATQFTPEMKQIRPEIKTLIAIAAERSQDMVDKSPSRWSARAPTLRRVEASRSL